MWFLGHTALGFGFALLVLALGRRLRPLDARVLVLVPFFANLIDFFHLDEIRDYSHNWVAALALPLLALLIWQRWMRWSKAEALALIAASVGEPVGDLTFGTFYPFGPVSWQRVGLLPFNGPVDLTVEAFLAVGLLAILVLLVRTGSGPRSLRAFRGPWILSPGLVVALTSLLFWGEVVTYVQLGTWQSQGILGVAVLAEMILAASLVTGLWALALRRPPPGASDAPRIPV